ncbi:MAG: hypothetical protein ACRDRX_07030 [Pseudonocardiaceae bacterium]
MTTQLNPASDRDSSGFPRPRTGSYGTVTSDIAPGLGVRPGESDPTRMLAAVLVIVVVAIFMGLTLAWWLV